MADDSATATEAVTAPQPAGAGTEIASFLVRAGHLTADQLRYAQRVHTKLGTNRTLLSVLEELRFITPQQVRETLRTHRVSVRLGALLVELGYLREADLKMALSLQKERPGQRLGEVLTQNHFIGENELYDVLADQLGFERVSLATCDLDRRLLRGTPVKWFAQRDCLPVRTADGRLLVAFVDPLNQDNITAVRQLLGDDFTVAITSPSDLKRGLGRLEIDQAAVPAAQVRENAIVTEVQTILQDALKDGVSDIHVEPMKDRLRIRFRQDGTLAAYRDLPLDMSAAFTSRIKVLAGADIAERRRHQDGRILFETSTGEIDIRVSVYVTIHGEKVVMRLLNNRSTLLDVHDTGMAPRMLQHYLEDALDAPSGVVLVTGPTGSGKTTTLYASINYLNDAKTSIITAEDPVEYVIDGISQCSINPKISVSYEETLKHIVRQDPDVIVIGEIRDLFSAETAIQAALTGHKVLTTFHTEDSIGGLLRLLNMNIEAFLISSTVVSVVAQRLLRRVCPDCAEDHLLKPHELRRLGYELKDAPGLTFRQGRGCSRCRHLGYRGRVAIFELLVLSEPVKDAVISRKTSYEIRRISTESSGLVTLLEDGIVKAAGGLTSFEEIIRMLPRLSKPRPLPELRRLLGVSA